jgi:HlyD family secretion protein
MKIGNRTIPRKTLAWYVGLGLALAALATFGLESIYGTSSASPGTARTVSVERGTVQSSVSASGNVSAATSDSVSFGTSGTVTAVDVTAGQTVTAGQVLGTIDPTDAQATLASAQAALGAAQYSLTSAEQGGTAAELEQDKASLETAQSQLTTDQDQLSTDETDLTDAQNQLATDEAQGCPAATASSSSSTGSGSGLGAQDASATTGTATSDSDTALTFTGTVDTGGVATNYEFEYGTTSAFGSEVSGTAAGAATPTEVSATVTGLTPDTTYLYELVVGSSVGVAETATTASSACVVGQQTVTTDQQTVAKDKATLSAQEMTVAADTDNQAVVPTTVAQDQAQVLEDQDTVTADQKALSETTLTAPISGTVTAVNDVVGDTVSGGGTSAASDSSSSDSSSSDSSSTGASSTGGSTGLGGSSASTGASTGASTDDSSDSSSSSAFATIENLGGLEVVAGYAEADIAKMAAGETATITLPALPDSSVTGTVTAVAPTSTVVSNVVTYDVTIALDSPPSTVKVGMTADVSVVVQTATNTLELPSAAITTTGPISTVTVLANGVKKVTRVTTGLVGDSTTQIESGVKAGQVVVEPVASVAASTTGATGLGGLTGGGGFGGFGGGFGGGGGFTRAG